MARFYDRICRNDSALSGLPVFVFDNVHDYLVGLGDQTEPVNFHCVRPPFPSMWVEWKGEHKQGRNPYYLVGVRLLDDDASVVPALTSISDVPKDADRAMLTDIYISSSSYTSPVAHAIYYYQNSGFPVGRSRARASKFWENPHAAENVVSTIGSIVEGCMLLGLSFLNAKNTELIDNPPPAKLSKRHQKKYGVPLVTYKTLKVNPIRKVNANDHDDASDGDSIPKSLHIVRGHFADYRNGPGLFGKINDIVWKEAHVRGSAKAGVVVKDYDVQAESSLP